MTKSLKQLRKEKKMLLQKSNAKMILMNNKKRDMLERMKLEAEIKALKNPGSVRAKKVAGSLGKRAGQLIIKGSLAIGRHVTQLAREQGQMDRKQSKRKKGKR